MIESEKLVDGFIDLKTQLQPASFDLTLAEVSIIEGEGVLDFDNSKRVLSTTRAIAFENGFASLEKGVYKVRFNEAVRLPAGIAAFSTVRSSLARCGCTMHVGWWDPGYQGKGEGLLYVGNKIRLEKNARIAQIVFLRLGKEADELYAGIHHGENL